MTKRRREEEGDRGFVFPIPSAGWLEAREGKSRRVQLRREGTIVVEQRNTLASEGRNEREGLVGIGTECCAASRGNINKLAVLRKITLKCCRKMAIAFWKFWICLHPTS